MSTLNFNFSAADLSAATAALREFAEFFDANSNRSSRQRAYAAHYRRIADLLEAHSSSVSATDMRMICAALKFHLSNNPMDWNAHQLFTRLSSVCGFVDTIR